MKPDRWLAALIKAGLWVPVDLPVIFKSEGDDFTRAQQAAGLLSVAACLIFMPKPFAFLIIVPSYMAGNYAPYVLQKLIRTAVEAEIDAALPDFVDLMTVLIEAGIELTMALRFAAKEADGALKEHLDMALAEVELGLTKQEALSGAAAASPSDEFKSFARIFTEADKYGAPVAVELRAFADDARDKQFSRAREEAQKLPIKMLFPLVFMILPAFVLLTAGPLIVSMIY